MKAFLILVAAVLGAIGMGVGIEVANSADSAAVVPRCRASQLSVSFDTLAVAMGSIEARFHFQNHSTTTCTLRGFPAVRLIGRGGRRLQTEVHDGAWMTIPARPVHLVVLSATSDAHFALGYEDGTGFGHLVCPMAEAMRITAPGTDAARTISLQARVYGGGTVATVHCGEVFVSPIYR